MATMFTLDFRLMCVVFPLMPVFLIFRKNFEARLRQASDVAQESQQRKQLSPGTSDVHCSGATLAPGGRQTDAFVDYAKARVKALNRREWVQVLFSSSFMAVVALGTIAILGYGGYQVFVGALTVGGMVAFYSYMGGSSIRSAPRWTSTHSLNRLSTNIRRIMEVTEMTPSVPELANAVNFCRDQRGMRN